MLVVRLTCTYRPSSIYGTLIFTQKNTEHNKTSINKINSSVEKNLKKTSDEKILEKQESKNKPMTVAVVKTPGNCTAISSALMLLNWTELKTLSNDAGLKIDKFLFCKPLFYLQLKCRGWSEFKLFVSLNSYI